MIEQENEQEGEQDEERFLEHGQVLSESCTGARPFLNLVFGVVRSLDVVIHIHQIPDAVHVVSDIGIAVNGVSSFRMSGGISEQPPFSRAARRNHPFPSVSVKPDFSVSAAMDGETGQ